MRIECRCEGVNECLEGIFTAVAQGNLLLIPIALGNRFGDLL
jgi:hypothetical protein